MYGSVPGGNTDPGALLCVLEEEKQGLKWLSLFPQWWLACSDFLSPLSQLGKQCMSF